MKSRTCCVCVITLVQLFGCSSGSSDNGNSSSTTAGDNNGSVVKISSRVISGTVYSEIGSQPVAGATIVTSPETQTVRSNLDGSYQLIDTREAPGSVEYALRVKKTGYGDFEQRIGATPGNNNTFDVQLVPNAGGLFLNPNTLNIPFERNSATFFINGTSASTQFSISSTSPWLSATPSSGVIENSDSTRVDINIDRSLVTASNSTAKLTVSSNNSANAIMEVSVAVASNEEPRASAEVNTGISPSFQTDQADCRRPDILRIWTDNSDAALVVFPQTTVLPGDEGTYTLNVLPFSLYADSFQVNKAGTLTVTHLSGGDATTVASIIDIDQNNFVDLLFDDSVPLEQGTRSQLTAFLEPGLYCYVLRPPTGVFFSFSQYRLQVDFISN